MSKQPYMPFFFGDFLAATAAWEGEEQSLYMLLLAYQWANGPLPNEPERIARMCRYDKRRFSKLWKTVSRKFVLTESGWTNPRLEEHREKAHKITEKRKDAGVNGAAAKWGETPGKTPGKSRSERLSNARALGTHSDSEWSSLVEICGDSCVRCGTHKQHLIGGSLCKDHITPIYIGGSDAIANIQPMCRNCNSSKGQDTTDFRPKDWAERLAKRLAKMTNEVCHPIQSNPEEESKSRCAALAGDSKPEPPDPRKQLFELGKTILGKSSGGLISKQIALSDESTVAKVLGEMALSTKADPKGYFVKATTPQQRGFVA